MPKIASPFRAESPTLPQRGDARRILGTLVGCYLLMLVGGLIVLRSPGASARGNEVTLDRAVFTVVNAGTLTGFQQAVDGGGSAQGQKILLALTVGASFLVMAAGGLGLARVLRLPYSDTTILLAAAAVELTATVAGATLLGTGDTPFVAALLRSAGAFGNSGITVSPSPGMLELKTHLVLFPLAVVGGLGLTVLMEMFDAIFLRRSLSSYARRVLTLSAWFYLASFLLLFAIRGIGFHTDPGEPFWRPLLAASSFQAINLRTLGLPIETPAAWPRAMQWCAMLLMLIGANHAGTGGGIKLITADDLFDGVRRGLTGTPPNNLLATATAWTAIYTSIIFVTTIFLLTTEPQLPGDRVLFLAVSATSNVGLSHDPIAITGPGLYALSLTMLLGRATPIAMLWHIATTTGQSNSAEA